MSFWCLHLNSITTNFWIKKCAKQFKPDLKTYSIGFKDEPVFDETRYAEQMASHINSDHTSFVLTNDHKMYTWIIPSES